MFLKKGGGISRMGGMKKERGGGADMSFGTMILPLKNIFYSAITCLI